MDLAITILVYWFLSLCLILCLWYVVRSVVIWRAETRRAKIAADEFYKLVKEMPRRDKS